MSEATENLQPIATAGHPTSAGAMLRSARQASGLHVAALAVAMKVPVKKLEALESDRFDLLLDAVFVRALAASVCRTLKIDPAPILEKLPQSIAPRLGAEQNRMNTPYYSSGHARKLLIPSALTKPSVLAVVALLFAATFLVLFPSSQPAEKVDDSTSVASVAPLTTEDDGPRNANALKPVSGGTLVTPADGATEASVQGVNVASSPATAIPNSVTTDIVTFKVRGTSWVEVTDSKGVVQLRKTLTTGESVSTSGVLPLFVVVGKADVTDVVVRGQPFPIGELSKDNVARFEVK